MAQWVGHPALDFGSGPDLWIMGSSLASDSALSRESAWDSLSLPLALPYSL